MNGDDAPADTLRPKFDTPKSSSNGTTMQITVVNCRLEYWSSSIG